VTDERKALAWRPTEHDIDVSMANRGCLPDRCACQPLDRSRQHRASGKIERVNCRMDGIDFDRGHNVETRLLEAKTQTARTRE
jgi:hypothetical protein